MARKRRLRKSGLLKKQQEVVVEKKVETKKQPETVQKESQPEIVEPPKTESAEPSPQGRRVKKVYHKESLRKYQKKKNR